MKIIFKMNVQNNLIFMILLSLNLIPSSNYVGIILREQIIKKYFILFQFLNNVRKLTFTMED